ncbi:hypothetical protein QBC38DRAFT_509014 [Podospora fimiseda]|uniref:Uncharacterized protein n=1 Tax=Podospora fimiseda TaxID=252190 RepID=A0AAN7H3U2_9PEZI|nr:hypothetical protein QBC38DRAFT_509014 [Podospora fimiseda]
MPPNRWEDIRDDLFDIIYKLTGPLTTEDQGVVEREMQARGFDIKWNAIRFHSLSVDPQIRGSAYSCSSLSFSSTFSLTQTPNHHHHHTSITNNPYNMSKPGRVLMVWDQAVHEDLLVCLVSHLKPENKDYKAITELMHAKGYTFSEAAFQFFSQTFPSTSNFSPCSLSRNHSSFTTKVGQTFFAMPSGHSTFKAPTEWNWDAHLTLLQAVMEHAAPNQQEWEKILESVAKKGYKYTASAAIANNRMSWDHAADHVLLSCLIKVLNPTQENLRSVMEEMHTLGYTCTIKAITQHLQKLRRKENSTPANGNGAGDPATPQKPTRGRKPKGVKTPGTPAAGKRKTPAKADDGDDCEPEPKPAVKKARVKKEAEAATAKAEATDDGDDDDGE